MPDEVRVATFPNEMMARYWADVLEQEGIPGVVKPQMGGYGVFGHMSYVPHSLYVLKKDEERALALLDEADEEDD